MIKIDHSDELDQFIKSSKSLHEITVAIDGQVQDIKVAMENTKAFGHEDVNEF